MTTAALLIAETISTWSAVHEYTTNQFPTTPNTASHTAHKTVQALPYCLRWFLVSFFNWTVEPHGVCSVTPAALHRTNAAVEVRLCLALKDLNGIAATHCGRTRRSIVCPKVCKGEAISLQHRYLRRCERQSASGE